MVTTIVRSQRLLPLLSLLFLCTWDAVLHAQGTSGNITGQVLDQTGLGVPGARVTATNVETNVPTSTMSTSSGNYNISVYPGNYRIAAESQGFKRYLRDGVTVTASSTVRVDPTLEVGSVAESVEVSGAMLNVQTENAKVTTSVENKFVDQLPLVVGGTLRNPYDLVTIAAQVTSTGGAEMSLGGAQSRTYNATLDGIAITTNRPVEANEIAYAAPSLEAITEFAVDTGGFKAEYGQAAGGVITFSSRSGTNAFHGTVYEFLRNEALDARKFFESKRSVYKQSDFGVAGGGPIVLPKLYNGRNRTFFFLTYEGFRNRVGANSTFFHVPTPEMYDGNFTNWVDRNNRQLPIYDPATTKANPAGGFIRDPFPNNQIPKNRFSAFSQKLIPYGQLAKPNRGGQPGTFAYINQNFVNTSGVVLEPQDKGSAKIDHAFNDKHRIGGFMNISRYRGEFGGNGTPGLPLPLYSGSIGLTEALSYRITHDWIVSPTLLNNFSYGKNEFYKNTFSPNYQGNWADKLCFKNAVDCNVNFPVVGFSEFSGWGTSARSGHEQPTWSIKDDLSYSRGKHSFKFGFLYQILQSTGFGEQNIAGQAGFSYLGTGVPGNTNFTSGSSFASFLLGDANTGATETVRENRLMYPNYSFYAQDDWHISRRLTLNLGLRWDFATAPTEKSDWYSDFSPTKPNPAVNNYPGAQIYAGFGEGRENKRSLVPGWYKGIGPRLGLAYSLNDKTTIRSAFGRSFNRVTVARDSGHYLGFIGRYNFASLNSGITPAFNWDAGLPSYPLPISVDPKAKLDPAFANNDEVHYHPQSDAARAPESLYWTFSIQRQLAGNTVLEVAYSANIGTHLMGSLVNINQVPTAVWNSYVQRFGAAGATSLFRSDINSAAARSAGVPIPYANFTDPNVQRVRTVNQALRPFPQFSDVITGVRGNGDKSGHSSYHALIVKMARRYHNGLALEWNYVFSKLLTDTDNPVEGNGTTQDQYNRRLEKSIGEYDQTHSLKMSSVYELPIGRGKQLLGTAPAVVNAVIGGWRLGGIMTYASGFPINLTRNNPLAIFNRDTRPLINGYDNWRGAIKGDDFDPATDRFLIPKTAFPTQPVDFGNATRHNPKVRTFPYFQENVSLAKKFAFNERFSMDFRAEAFNLLNRVRFNPGSFNLDNANFGVVLNTSGEPRRMQLGLKLYW